MVYLVHFFWLLIICSFYAYLFLSHYGLGLLVADRLKGSSKRDPFFLAWMGWALSLFLFQGIHLLLPIHFWTAMPLHLVGVFYILYRWKDVYAGFRRIHWRLQYLLLGMQILWIISKGLWFASWGDSGLYHFNAVRWINTYPIVPGLGNLHARLAFDDSLFVFVASLNIRLNAGFGYAVANSYLLSLAVATCYYFIFQFEALAVRQLKIVRVMGAMLLLVFICYIYNSNMVSSPAPDLACAIAILIYAFYFYLYFHYRHVSPTALILMGFCLASLKMSIYPIVGCVSLAVLLNQHSIGRMHRIQWQWVIVGCALCFGLYFSRNIILSGALLFPSDLLYVENSWSMPLEEIQKYKKLVYSWARWPRQPYTEVLGNWNWIGPWIEWQLSTRRHLVNFVFPFLACIFIFILTCCLTCGRSLSKKNLLVLSPFLISMILWFFTAPDSRFANGVPFVLLVFGATIFFRHLSVKFDLLNLVKCVFYSMHIIWMFAIGCSVLLNMSLSGLNQISTIGLRGVRTEEMIQKRTFDGTVIYLPLKGDHCWDSALPSTPYFNPHLRLRRKGDLSGGFLNTAHSPEDSGQE